MIKKNTLKNTKQLIKIITILLFITTTWVAYYIMFNILLIN